MCVVLKTLSTSLAAIVDSLCGWREAHEVDPGVAGAREVVSLMSLLNGLGTLVEVRSELASFYRVLAVEASGSAAGGGGWNARSASVLLGVLSGLLDEIGPHPGLHRSKYVVSREVAALGRLAEVQMALEDGDYTTAVSGLYDVRTFLGDWEGYVRDVQDTERVPLRGRGVEGQDLDDEGDGWSDEEGGGGGEALLLSTAALAADPGSKAKARARAKARGKAKAKAKAKAKSKARARAKAKAGRSGGGGGVFSWLKGGGGGGRGGQGGAEGPSTPPRRESSAGGGGGVTTTTATTTTTTRRRRVRVLERRFGRWPTPVFTFVSTMYRLMVAKTTLFFHPIIGAAEKGIEVAMRTSLQDVIDYYGVLGEYQVRLGAAVIGMLRRSTDGGRGRFLGGYSCPRSAPAGGEGGEFVTLCAAPSLGVLTDWKAMFVALIREGGGGVGSITHRWESRMKQTWFVVQVETNYFMVIGFEGKVGAGDRGVGEMVRTVVESFGMVGAVCCAGIAQ